jgi:hypothetical protein
MNSPFLNWEQQFNSPFSQNDSSAGSSFPQPSASFPAYDSPLEDRSLFQEEPEYVEYIDFKKLLKDIGENKGKSFYYDYREYESHISVPLKGLVSSYEVMDVVKDVLDESGLEIPEEIYPPKQRVNNPYRNKDNQNIFFSGRLNTRPGMIKIAKGHIGFSFWLDYTRKLPIFTDHFLYEEDNLATRARKVAFIIEAHNYEDYQELCRIEGLSLMDSSRERIISDYTKALAKAKGQPDTLDWLYYRMPDFVLERRDKALILEDVASLLSADVDETGSDYINEEALVLKLLNTFFTGKVEDHDLLLGALYTLKVGSRTMMEALWRRMDDYGGADNFTATVQTIYKIWLLSSFSSPSYRAYKYNGEPETIAYHSKEILGFYSSGFSFFFRQDKILAYKKESREYVSTMGIVTAPRDVLYATYHMFQPIRLPEVDQEGELKLPDQVIPAFYLKAFDDKSAWANFEKSVWLTIDVVTTLIGVGELMQLRHLLKLRSVGGVFRVLNGAVQVASGTLGIMLDLVGKCQNERFCEKLRNFLFWLDLATIGADALTFTMLRRSAREALDEMPANVKAKHPDVESQLDEIAASGRSRKMGQKITKAELVRVEKFLKEMGCEFQMVPEVGEHVIPTFFDAMRQPTVIKKNAWAMFVTDGKRMRLVLRQNATGYEFFHELMHLRHARQLGLTNYYRLGNTSYGTLVKEQYVMDKIIQNKHFFTRAEIYHAWEYVNLSVYSNFGKDPIPLDFDLTELPEVRKEFQIEELFKIK